MNVGHFGAPPLVFDLPMSRTMEVGCTVSSMDEIVTFHQKPLSSKTTFIKNHFGNLKDVRFYAILNFGHF